MTILENLQPLTGSLSADDREILEIAIALAKATRKRRLDTSDLARLCVNLAYRLRATESALQAERGEVERLQLLMETYKNILTLSGLDLDIEG